jgi:hypothetical protein
MDAALTRAVRQRISLALLVLLCIAVSGCCEEEVPQIYRAGFDFAKPTESVTISGAADEIELDRRPSALGERIRADYMSGRVAGEDWGFNLGLTSTSSEPVRILWTQASYTDELGRSHPLLVYSGGGLPRPDDPVEDVTLRNDKEIMFAVTVAGKTKKLRTSCTSWTARQEPIVPWEQRENPYVTRDEVARLAREGYQMEYLVPIEHAGEKKTLRLVFGLEKRTPEGEWAPMGLY